LGWFCREFQATYSGIRILREIDLQEEDVPEPLKIVIFRIVQEAMNNVVKHSTADKVRLRLTKSDGALDLEIEDNGPGFDLSEAFSSDSATKGFGLASMKERTDFSGGSFTVQSGAGSGTAIRVSWPAHAPVPTFR
jgi:signal transduction histidine kinase